ncbi:hypothetical protein B0T17DRAFT_511875 [Bombardia bombarda]|uniref:Uncharacterized protein n=1 Tax=Bombardia bombarda TaxID=252184 RepID=A0AA39TGS4_9PEZI|nr:hypothetical protein B0T17DRAFT_511875 [Bombardia bombarda]
MEHVVIPHLQVLINSWSTAVDISRSQLEGFDHQLVEECRTFMDLENKIAEAINSNMAILSAEFRYLESKLTALDNFCDFLTTHLSHEFDTSLVWGLCRLLIQLLRENEAIIPRLVPRTVLEILDDMNLIHVYLSLATSATIQGLETVYVDSGIAVIGFLSYVITFVRNNVPRATATLTDQPHDIVWKDLTERCTSTATEFLTSTIEGLPRDPYSEYPVSRTFLLSALVVSRRGIGALSKT